MARLGELALTAAAARPSEVALDIGCGAGGTTLALARVVAPTGHVLGLDLSAAMALEATQRAAAAGITNVRFAAGDASTYAFDPGTADLLFSRFGVMFFGDPASAFGNMRGALRRGGRVVFLCWRAFKENPWAAVPFMAGAPLLPQQPRPGPDEPGPFSFADPARVTRILSAAAFDQVTIEPVDIQVALSSGDLDEAVAQVTEAGPLSRALQDAAPDVRAQVLDAVRGALLPYRSADGIRLAAACWLVRAINPG
ncbi:MAG TPA: class I SAM-dependent methyltransferase [Vineibacter sp.]|nr:class I SAM-dependent methyltransferase [Vineibacter sp.]